MIEDGAGVLLAPASFVYHGSGLPAAVTGWRLLTQPTS
jgi:hypothetical protein